MVHRALLIGSETDNLSGVANDITAMANALEPWGFTSIRREHENASRAGILDAYERLISQAKPDEAVVVYYSGHGAYAEDPERGAGTPSPRTIQLIVPTDIDESTEDDFRGVTALELSVLLARLTERTRNVTVVLDCCHSAHMSRVRDKVVKGRTRPIDGPTVLAHLDTLKRDGLALDLWRPPGNPHAVRIVACAPQQQAYEAANADGIQMGYLTDALTRVLAEVKRSGMTMSWATVVNQVRQRVLGRWLAQRPEAEGPAQRILFDTAESALAASLPVVQVRDRIHIAGAALLGVRPGDRFVVMPDDTPDPDDAHKIGDVRVEQIDAQAAYGKLIPREPDVSVPLGARAHLVRTALPALPVEFVDDPRLSELVEAIHETPIVRVAENGETAAVRVEAGAEGLTLHDALGPLHSPRPASDTDVVVADLKQLARARALCGLIEEPGLTLDTSVSIQLGRVDEGSTVPLTTSGDVVYSGQSICVTVENEGDEPVYVSLLDVGVSSQISVLNPWAPSGVRINPRKAYTFGANDVTGSLPGMAVQWPESVPPEVARTETIVVVVSAEPTDTQVLTQPGIVKRDAPPTQLEQYLRRLGLAKSREVSPEAGRPVRFAVHTIDFTLVPTAAPPAETTAFQVDERPTPAAFLWNERSPVHADVGLRLSDLVVHHNRAFRDTDVRFDTLVVTEDAMGRTEFHVHTARFTGIEDGERLPLTEEVVYRGTARKYLQIAMWVSPDGPLDLADRLPAASLSVAALVDAAGTLLQQALGRAVPLYRATLLGTENFGRGDLPRPSAVRAKDFSFRYTAIEHSSSFVSSPSE